MLRRHLCCGVLATARNICVASTKRSVAFSIELMLDNRIAFLPRPKARKQREPEKNKMPIGLATQNVRDLAASQQAGITNGLETPACDAEIPTTWSLTF